MNRTIKAYLLYIIINSTIDFFFCFFLGVLSVSVSVLCFTFPFLFIGTVSIVYRYGIAPIILPFLS